MENFKFEKLRIWKSAMDFGEEVFILSKEFPKAEMYNLSSQVIRASDSIALNIAEGATGQSNAEFNRFIGYSLRSLAEVVACLHKAIRRNYITNEVFSKIYNVAFVLMNSIAVFRNTLKPEVIKKG